MNITNCIFPFFIAFRCSICVPISQLKNFQLKIRAHRQEISTLQTNVDCLKYKIETNDGKTNNDESFKYDPNATNQGTYLSLNRHLSLHVMHASILTIKALFTFS